MGAGTGRDGPWAVLLDGAGGGRQLTMGEPVDRRPQQGALWVHMDSRSREARRWLAEEGGLGPADAASLLEDIVRSRVATTGAEAVAGGMQVVGGAPGERHFFLFHLTPGRLITLYDGRSPSFEAEQAALARGEGPRDEIDALARLARADGDRMLFAALRLDTAVADLEAQADVQPQATLPGLRRIQGQAAGLRRASVRQREVMARLARAAPPWLLHRSGDLWRELAERATEGTSALAEIVDRTRGLNDFIQNRLSASLNDRVYLLTLVSTIMLPLSFITSLLGVNVGGIPLSDVSWGFWALCLLLGVIGVGQFRLMRRLRWLPDRPTLLASAERSGAAGTPGGLAHGVPPSGRPPQGRRREPGSPARDERAPADQGPAPVYR
jgi:zinc transporter